MSELEASLRLMDELCPHGRIPTAFCHPCEMEKILDFDDPYGVTEPIKIADCKHGIRIDRPCTDCDRHFLTGLPSETQVAGDHYCTMAIQPAVYCHRNGIGYIKSRAINYLSRDKHNEREDVEKAIHMLQLWLEENKLNKSNQSSHVRNAEGKEG